MKNEFKRTEQIGFRTSKTVLNRLVTLSKNGFRSLSQQIELMLLDHPDMKDIKEKILKNKMENEKKQSK